MACKHNSCRPSKTFSFPYDLAVWLFLQIFYFFLCCLHGFNTFLPFWFLFWLGFISWYLRQYFIMINDISLDNKLQYEGDGIRYSIVPGKGWWKFIKNKQHHKRKNIWHILHHRVTLVRCHIHTVKGNKKACCHSCYCKQTDMRPI